MCLEDVRLNRKKRYRNTTILANAALAPVPILARRSNRTFIQICVNDNVGAVMQKSTDGPGLAGLLYVAFFSGQQRSFVFRLEEWGSAITDEWYVQSLNGIQSFYASEVWLDEE